MYQENFDKHYYRLHPDKNYWEVFYITEIVDLFDH